MLKSCRLRCQFRAGLKFIEFATIHEVLTTHNLYDLHRATSNLSERQTDDLIEFVRSIGYTHTDEDVYTEL